MERKRKRWDGGGGEVVIFLGMSFEEWFRGNGVLRFIS